MRNLEARNAVTEFTIDGQTSRFYDQRSTTYACQGGDSGGSVTNGGGLAMGVQSARDTFGPLCYYSHIYNVRATTDTHGLVIS